MRVEQLNPPGQVVTVNSVFGTAGGRHCLTAPVHPVAWLLDVRLKLPARSRMHFFFNLPPVKGARRQ